MSRRVSPLQLVFALLVLVLWSAVLFDGETRYIARLHLRNSMAPRGFDFTLPFTPTPRVDLQTADAANNRDWKTLSALIEANPRDALPLAIYIRSGEIKPQLYNNLSGPLVSGFTDWSVQISAGPGAPDGYVPLPSSPSKSPDTTRYFQLVARGQQLEPQNNYWDWMEMAALVAAHRERELDAVVHRATRKPIFDDHTTDELRARITYDKCQKLAFAPGTSVFAYSFLPLPHLQLLTTTSKIICQRVMGLRLEGRNAEALRLGIDGMRLARMMRLQATTPLASESAARNEQLFIEQAGVRLGTRPYFRPRYLTVSSLASDPASLLFLAKSNPSAASEIATEWQGAKSWRVGASSSLFGNLIAKNTMRDIGWTTRAASFFIASLTVAFIAWGVLFACGHKQEPAPITVSPSLLLWGTGIGLALLLAFLVCDLSMAQVFDTPENWLVMFPSLLNEPRVAWGGVVLCLLWVALWVRPRSMPATSTSKRRIEDWEEPLLESVPFQLLDWLWRTLEWGAKAVVPLTLGMLFIGGASLMLLCWFFNRSADPLWAPQQLLLLTVSLGVFPSLWVWGREQWYRAGTLRRRFAPQIFVARARLLLGGYLMLALLALPILFYAQSRFEREFARQFAPIEQGQMVAAIQKMRGIPMR